MPVSFTQVDVFVRQHQTQILLVKAWNYYSLFFLGKWGLTFWSCAVVQEYRMGSLEITCWTDLTSFSLDSAEVLPSEVGHGQKLPPESACSLGDVSSASGESKRMPKDGKVSGRVT